MSGYHVFNDSLISPATHDYDYDPFSKCYETDHPCCPGALCPGDNETICTSDCGNYASYSEDDPREDR